MNESDNKAVDREDSTDAESKAVDRADSADAESKAVDRKDSADADDGHTISESDEKDKSGSDSVVEVAGQVVMPGKNTLAIDKILGFNLIKDYQSDKKGVELSDERLKIEAVGQYTGEFLEDGSDEPIVGVSSVIITNQSDEMLQVADISIPVNNNETAEYRVTNLLPYTSALVLEKNKRLFSEKDKYKRGEVISAFIRGQSLMEDTFEIIEENEQLTLINKTENNYKKVYVYYKYIQSGGAYLGGITYRVPFENVEERGRILSVANHFAKGTSQIVDVQITE